MKKKYIMLMLLCLILTSCGKSTRYDSTTGISYVNFPELVNACDKNWAWCDDMLEVSRIDNHKCRTTDGIKKKQQEIERVVNNTIIQKYTKTVWKVSNGFDDCYLFTSYDNREYNVKNKFISTRLGKPTENETIVKEIIIDDNSFLTKTDRHYIRNFYDSFHKKKRPLNTDEKYELYEQKHLRKDTKENRKPCHWKDYTDITKCELYPTQFKTPLFSIDEIIELQKENKDAKIGFYDYENKRTFVFVGANFTDQDVENFASGYYSLQDGLIKISKTNQKRVAQQLKIDQEKKDRACWFEEYETMGSCHRNFFFGNAYLERQAYKKKFGPKVIYNTKRPDKNGHYIKWLCHNSTINDRIRFGAYNKQWSININYVENLPNSYCILN